MLQTQLSYPLQWPANHPRTPIAHKSLCPQFPMGISAASAIELVKDELQAMGVSEAIFYSNFEDLSKPNTNQRLGNDNGIALQFRLKGKLYRLACDRWALVEQNIYALHLSLRHLRHVADWGVGTLEHAFGGFFQGFSNTAVNANSGGHEEWRLELGLGPTATIEDAHAVYRRRAKLFANDEDALMRLNLAMDAANRAIGEKI